MTTLPAVPATVWEQIPVVITFALLLAGMAWLLMKVFAKTIADINSHYAAVIKSNNEQWQKYIDAKQESANLITQQMMHQMEELTESIRDLRKDFDGHDQLERQYFEMHPRKQRPEKKP